jgi:hypothetical protein
MTDHDGFTHERIADLRKICGAAPEGPWQTSVDTNEGYAGKINIISDYEDGDPWYVAKAYANIPGSTAQDAASFIAAARTALPAALDEIERLAAERDSWHKAAMDAAVYVGLAQQMRAERDAAQISNDLLQGSLTHRRQQELLAERDTAIAERDGLRAAITDPLSMSEIIEIGKGIFASLPAHLPDGDVGALAYDGAVAVKKVFRARLVALTKDTPND